MMQSLREGGRGGSGAIRGQRIRSVFVMAQLALAVVLLTGAGLLIRSFLELTRVDPGFRAANAVTFRLSLQGATYADEATRLRFFTELETRLRALPGVTEVGAATGLPMTGNAALVGPFQAEGRDVPEGVIADIRLVTVTPNYFDAIGGRLMRGRPLQEHDRADAPPVALINRAAIARWFPDGDPVGERVLLGTTPITIVGVVDDVLQGSPTSAVAPEMYAPFAQNTGRSLRLVVRGTGDMTQIASRIRTEVRGLDARLPIGNIEPLETVVNDAFARPRFYTTLMVLFAAIAMTLAVVGIFGVMNYLVAQRSREISIRMALGANRGKVIGMVVGNAMAVAGAGLVLGLAGALSLSGVLRSQLYGVRVSDPATLLGVLGVLAFSAAIASVLPARRAAGLDPGAALRDG
jgi:putative ABC transport system permease protein